MFGVILKGHPNMLWKSSRAWQMLLPNLLTPELEPGFFTPLSAQPRSAEGLGQSCGEPNTPGPSRYPPSELERGSAM